MYESRCNNIIFHLCIISRPAGYICILRPPPRPLCTPPISAGGSTSDVIYIYNIENIFLATMYLYPIAVLFVQSNRRFLHGVPYIWLNHQPRPIHWFSVSISNASAVTEWLRNIWNFYADRRKSQIRTELIIGNWRNYVYIHTRFRRVLVNSRCVVLYMYGSLRMPKLLYIYIYMCPAAPRPVCTHEEINTRRSPRNRTGRKGARRSRIEIRNQAPKATGDRCARKSKCITQPSKARTMYTHTHTQLDVVHLCRYVRVVMNLIGCTAKDDVIEGMIYLPTAWARRFPGRRARPSRSCPPRGSAVKWTFCKNSKQIKKKLEI